MGVVMGGAKIFFSRSAYLSCLKVLKLLLVAQGYSFILSVSQEIKNNSGECTELY